VVLVTTVKCRATWRGILVNISRFQHEPMPRFTQIVYPYSGIYI
jgi:hypothetical protein